MKELPVDRLPRLIVLASCESARNDDHLSPLGPKLAAAGIPAIVAMQGKISMETVEQAMPVFFAELAKSGQVDQAMAAARGEVRNQWDAWMPALFSRITHGRLWLEEPKIAGLLAAYPPPRLKWRENGSEQVLNPYDALGLAKGEAGDEYDFEARLPPYVRRDDDSKIDEILAGYQGKGHGGGFLLLVGPSKCGKSRAAFEALLRNCGDRRLLKPESASSVDDLLTHSDELSLPSGKAVLWLDDLDRYLYKEAVNDNKLRRLIDDRGLLVVATIWDTRYSELRRLKGSAGEAGQALRQAGVAHLAEDVLRQADVVRIESSMSAGELDRARQTYSALEFRESSWDAFVAWPLLIDRFENGSIEMRAVVTAAADMYRAGVSEPISADVLRELFKEYRLQADPGLYVGEDGWKQSFGRGLEEAVEPVGARQRLLKPDPPGSDTFGCFPRIVYRLEKPVPQWTWETALRLPEVNPLAVGISAYRSLAYEMAEQAFRQGVGLGEGQAAHNLGVLLAEQGKTDEAIAAFRQGAELGQGGAVRNLGLLLAQQDKL